MHSSAASGYSGELVAKQDLPTLIRRQQVPLLVRRRVAVLAVQAVRGGGAAQGCTTGGHPAAQVGARLRAALAHQGGAARRRALHALPALPRASGRLPPDHRRQALGSPGEWVRKPRRNMPLIRQNRFVARTFPVNFSCQAQRSCHGVDKLMGVMG